MSSRNGNGIGPVANAFARASAPVRDKFADMVHNLSSSRDRFFKHFFMDDRRDIYEECGWPKHLTIEHYKALYDRSGVAARVVDLFPSECWQSPPHIYEDEDPGRKTVFEKSIEDLDNDLSGSSWHKATEGDNSFLFEILRRGDELSGVGSFGVLLLGFDDGKDLSEPVEGLDEYGRATNLKEDVETQYVDEEGNVLSKEELEKQEQEEREEEKKAKLEEKQAADEVKAELFKQQQESKAKVLKDQGLEQEAKAVQEGAKLQEKQDAKRRELEDKQLKPVDNDVPSMNVLSKELGELYSMGTDAQYTDPLVGTGRGEPPKRKDGEGLGLLYVKAFDESLVQILEYENNPANPRYGLPKRYRITLNDPEHAATHGGVGLDTTAPDVHWTRVIHLAETTESSDTFAVSRMRKVFNNLINHQKISGGSAEMYWKAAFMGLSLETHPNMGGDVDVPVDDLKDQMEQYMNGLQRYIWSAGMSAKTLAPQVSDPTPQLNNQIQEICIKMGCPKRIFEGSERGELSSSQDSKAWDDRVVARCKNYLSPRVIAPFFDRLIAVGVLPQPEKYCIEWDAKESLSESEKAEIAKQKMEAMTQFVKGEVESIMTADDMFTEVLGFTDDKAKAFAEHVKEAEPLDVSPPMPGLMGPPGQPPQAPGTQPNGPDDQSPGSDGGGPQNGPQPPQPTENMDILDAAEQVARDTVCEERDEWDEKYEEIVEEVTANVIRKLDDGKYRLYSKAGKNLGTFDSRSAAQKHEREVEYFKRQDNKAGEKGGEPTDGRFFSQVTDNNCGTGSGGFKPGNTCARGGGGTLIQGKTPKEWYAEDELPEGWYVHGRSGRQDLDTGHVIQLTRDWQTADRYANVESGGSMWMVSPEPSANVLDATDPSQTRKVVKQFKADSREGLLSPALDDVLMLDPSDEKLMDEMNPTDIVSSAGTWDNNDFSSWAAHRMEYDFVKTYDGGVVLGPQIRKHKVDITPEENRLFNLGFDMDEIREMQSNALKDKAVGSLDEGRIDVTDNNCGIGAGGFQPGNTCAKGGAGGFIRLRSLGGSTGAGLAKNDDGDRVVLKQGNHPDHIRDEHAANEMYRAAGVRVPDSYLREGENGQPQQVAEFIEGTPLSDLTGQRRQDAEAALQKDFATDALLANWDVIGLDEDNVVVDGDGNPWRIDNGGALRYRAQGSPKNAAWGGTVVEIDSLRERGTAGPIFGDLTDTEVARQIGDLTSKRQDILDATPDELKGTMEARLDHMGGWASDVLQSNVTGNNCGTGAGGFKPGNSCAKGGGSVMIGPEQRQASLDFYQGDGYVEINAALRNKEYGQLTEFEKTHVDAIDEQFEVEETGDVGELYRGSRTANRFLEPAGVSLPGTYYQDDLKNPQTQKELTEHIQGVVGTRFSDNAYFSTSQDRNVTAQFTRHNPPTGEHVSAIFNITGESPTIDVENVTGVAMGESEILLPRDTTFEITGARLTNIERRFGVMDTIPPIAIPIVEFDMRIVDP